MRIFGPTQLHGAQGINPPHYHRGAKATPSPSEVQHVSGDRLDISPAAEAAALSAETGANEVGAIRHELVAQIRQQIADGTYDTPEKLDLALDRFIDTLG